MFTFIIGAVVGLALFLCLRYCLDTPSPCGMGFDFDECPCCTVLPEIIFPEHGKYAGSSYQQNLSTFLGTYRDYLRLSKKYRDVAQIDSEASLTLFASCSSRHLRFSLFRLHPEFCGLWLVWRSRSVFTSSPVSFTVLLRLRLAIALLKQPSFANLTIMLLLAATPLHTKSSTVCALNRNPSTRFSTMF